MFLYGCDFFGKEVKMLLEDVIRNLERKKGRTSFYLVYFGIKNVEIIALHFYACFLKKLLG
jgi:hypothetical protein